MRTTYYATPQGSGSGGSSVTQQTMSGDPSTWPTPGATGTIYYNVSTTPVSTYIWNANTNSYVQTGDGRVDVRLTPINYIPTPTNNPVSDRNYIVQDPNGAWWVIDGAGEALKIRSSNSEFNQATTSIASSLPSSAPVLGLSHWFINLTAMTADIDLDTWTPTSLSEGAKVFVKKLDASSFKIGITSDGVRFNFVDKPGEFYSLLWDGSTFKVV